MQDGNIGADRKSVIVDYSLLGKSIELSQPIFSQSILCIKYLIFLVTIALSSNSIAQNNAQYYADSILSHLDTIQDLGDKIQFIKDKGRQFIPINDTVSLLINKQAINLAEKARDTFQMGMAYEERGVLFSITKQFSAARKPINKAIDLFSITEDSSRIGYGFRNLGITYTSLQQHDSAVTCFFTSLGFFNEEKESDQLFYGLTLLELAKAFFTTEAYRASLKYAEKAIDVLSKLDRPFDLAAAYNTKSIALMNLPETEETIEYIEEALKYSVVRQDTGSMIVHLHNFGLFLSRKEDFKAALDTLNKGLSLAKRFKQRNLVPYFNNSIGEIYLDQGDYKKAEGFFLDVINHYKSDSNPDYSPYQNSNLNLAKIREREGNYREALSHLKTARDLEIRYLQLENEKLIELYEKELESIEKDRALKLVTVEKELHAAKLKDSQQAMNYLLMVIVALIILLSIIYLFNQRLKTKNKEIEAKRLEILQQKEQLEYTNHAKENLISIIGHDMRGPLGNLSQLIDIVLLNEDSLSKDSQHALTLVKGSSNQMLHLLNNLLLWAKAEKRDLSVIAEDIDLVSLITNVTNLYEASFDYNNLNLNLDLPESLHAKTDGDSIETIIRNLVNNAVKFSSAGSNIKISAQSDDKSARIIIEDEAGSIPDHIVQDIFTNNRLDQNAKYNIKKGFGLKLCQELIALNDCKWEYNRTKKGSKITISLPIE